MAAQDPRLTNPVADTVYVTYNIQASQGVAAASAASAESQYVAARVVPLATGDGAAGNLPLRPGETPEAAAARYRKVPGVWLQPRGSPCAAGPAAGPPPAVQPASRTRQAYSGLPGAGECSYSALILWCLPMHAAASLCATQTRSSLPRVLLNKHPAAAPAPANLLPPCRAPAGVLSAAPELWAFAQDASGDDGVAASDTSAASPFTYYVPTGNKKWDESWAMVKTSVGYVWGRGVGGRSVDTAPSKDGDETRVCIIGEQRGHDACGRASCCCWPQRRARMAPSLHPRPRRRPSGNPARLRSMAGCASQQPAPGRPHLASPQSPPPPTTHLPPASALPPALPRRCPAADSGVDCEHPELKPMCADGAAFVHNRAPQLGLQYAQDESGHGTYMAGLVAAAANDKGMAGMLYKGVRRRRRRRRRCWQAERSLCPRPPLPRAAPPDSPTRFLRATTAMHAAAHRPHTHIATRRAPPSPVRIVCVQVHGWGRRGLHQQRAAVPQVVHLEERRTVK